MIAEVVGWDAVALSFLIVVSCIILMIVVCLEIDDAKREILKAIEDLKK